MKRTSLALFLVVFSACDCDPPTVADGDAGPEDAGDLTSVPDGGGEELDPSVFVYAQVFHGAVARVDITNGVVDWPLADGGAIGGITAHGEDLYVFSPSRPSNGVIGNIARVDLTNNAFTFLSLSDHFPRALATNGVEAATIPAAFDSLVLGALGADIELTESAIEPVAKAVAYDAEGLLVATEQGVGRYGEAASSTLQCRGIAYASDDDSILCALEDGSAILRIDSAGGETVVDDTAGSPYQSVTSLSDGSFVAVRDDCSVTSSRTLPDLSSLCPVSFTEVNGALLAGLRDGGVVEIEADGSVVLRLLGATRPGGVASFDGRFAAVGGARQDAAWVAGDGFVAPRIILPFTITLGAAFGDDGDLWVVDDSGLARVTAEDSAPSYVHSTATLEGLTRVGRSLYLLSTDGVQRLSLDDAPDYPLEIVSGERPSLIAGCDDVALLYIEESDQVLALAADGSTSVEVADASLMLGEDNEVDAIGCAGGQVLLSDESLISGRPRGSDEPFEILADVGSRIHHLVSAE